jgi:excisionase family DNA binding protein
MAIGTTTARAIAKLVQQDPHLSADERAGWLALLGMGRMLSVEVEAAVVRMAGAAGAWLSPNEAAARLGVSRATLYRWEHEGRVSWRRTRFGRRKVGLAVEDVERLMREGVRDVGCP